MAEIKANWSSPIGMSVEIHGKKRAVFANAWTSRSRPARPSRCKYSHHRISEEISPEYPRPAAASPQLPIFSPLHSPRRQEAQPITQRNQARAALLRTAGETDAMSHPTDARGWLAGRLAGPPTRLARGAPGCWPVGWWPGRLALVASASARTGEIFESGSASRGGMACRCGGDGFCVPVVLASWGGSGTTNTAWAQLSRSQGTAAAGWRKCAAFTPLSTATSFPAGPGWFMTFF